ncbi:complex 1 protein-domain-containing protein [Rhypophila decipiens]|uniref:Complex 1 protein-domain-containing protein n=1 Tax=Rhypophila decipiens TaxID=261697 RepID=A0AAN6YG85_9PEZI|nr:complex 1 protein-domain-containing protein [Rhypophila decipiens]
MSSFLRKEVTHLYRQCLRECRKKPAATQSHFRTFARNEFEKYKDVRGRDIQTIEHLLRKGRRQLEIYSSPSVKDIL